MWFCLCIRVRVHACAWACICVCACVSMGVYVICARLSVCAYVCSCACVRVRVMQESPALQHAAVRSVKRFAFDRSDRERTRVIHPIPSIRRPRGAALLQTDSFAAPPAAESRAARHCSRPFKKISCGSLRPIKTILVFFFSLANHGLPGSAPIIICTP